MQRLVYFQSIPTVPIPSFLDEPSESKCQSINSNRKTGITVHISFGEIVLDKLFVREKEAYPYESEDEVDFGA